FDGPANRLTPSAASAARPESITSRTLYHSFHEERRPTCGTGPVDEGGAMPKSDSTAAGEVPQFDIMLSYRRRDHTQTALRLAEASVAAGLRCWLDVWDIDQQIRPEQDEIRRRLREGATKSRIVVGFVDMESLALDPSRHESQILYNWRLYEHQF